MNIDNGVIEVLLGLNMIRIGPPVHPIHSYTDGDVGSDGATEYIVIKSEAFNNTRQEDHVNICGGAPMLGKQGCNSPSYGWRMYLWICSSIEVCGSS